MKPDWLGLNAVQSEKYAGVKRMLQSQGLNTVCVEAKCPNINNCWSGGTATFMILGNSCTRGCRFCAVGKSARGDPVDVNEPAKLAKTIKLWGLKYAVITSVCRDDLPDQGSGHFAECISAVRAENPKVAIEVLIPDFQSDAALLGKVVNARPDVISHNVEVTESLTPMVRDPRADYKRSIGVLAKVKELDSRIYTKSSLMLGFGEPEEDVLSTLNDLHKIGVDFLTIGQYLRPSSSQIAVKEYVTPERFTMYKEKAFRMGFKIVSSGPFVRSSYKAAECFDEFKGNGY